MSLLDEHVAFDYDRNGRRLRIDAFTDKHDYTIDRTRALPFKLAPGNSSQSSLAQISSGETGVTVSYDVSGRSNTIGAGASYLNLPYTIGLTFRTSPATVPRRRTSKGCSCATSTARRDRR